jgi:hypothetical protein
MSVRVKEFSYWFDLLKNQFLTIIYPEVCKKMGLLKQDDGTFLNRNILLFPLLMLLYADTGFKDYAPHELQLLVIEYLRQWSNNTSIVEFFLDVPAGTPPSENNIKKKQKNAFNPPM